jgi:lysophospholipase L1-like esterase
LHIGTNDFIQGRTVQSAVTNLDKIIDKLTVLRPNARLLVSSIIPLADAIKNAKVKSYNQQIRDVLVPKHRGLGRKVTFVDQYKNFVDSTGKVIASSLSDGVHPSRAGYDKIGDTWAQAILSATRKR